MAGFERFSFLQSNNSWMPPWDCQTRSNNYLGSEQNDVSGLFLLFPTTIRVMVVQLLSFWYAWNQTYKASINNTKNSSTATQYQWAKCILLILVQSDLQRVSVHCPPPLCLDLIILVGGVSAASCHYKNWISVSEDWDFPAQIPTEEDVGYVYQLQTYTR